MSRAMRRAALLSLIAALMPLVALAVHAAPAVADADPASDTLLVSQVFYPYQPKTPPALQQSLTKALGELNAHGVKLRVAVIGSAVDLGGIPGLFGQYQRYASFLETEISFHGPQPLLVVMPQGIASSHAGPASALAGVHVIANDGSAGLVQTAIAGVERIAAAEGHPIAAVSTSSSSGGGGVPVVVIVPVALVLLLAAGFAARIFARRRRAPAHSPGGKS